MKSFRKTFASLPLRLTVFAVILLGMCLRGGERAGLIANSSAKKKDASASPVLVEHNVSTERDLSSGKPDGISAMNSDSAQERSQSDPSNHSFPLFPPVQTDKSASARLDFPTDFFKRTSGPLQVDQ